MKVEVWSPFRGTSPRRAGRPGPWQASQLTPDMRRDGSKCPAVVDAVEWQPKQPRIVSGDCGPPAVIQVGNLHLPMTGRQVKSMNSLEITEVALVEHAFLFIDIRLAEVAA